MSTPEQPAQPTAPNFGQHPYGQPQQPAAPQNPYGQQAPQQPYGQPAQQPSYAQPGQQPQQSHAQPSQGAPHAQQQNPYAQQPRPAHPSGRSSLDTVAVVLAGAMLAWGVLMTLIIRIWTTVSTDYYMSGFYNGLTIVNLIVGALLAIGAIVFGLLAFSKSKHWLTGFALGTGIVGILLYT